MSCLLFLHPAPARSQAPPLGLSQPRYAAAGTMLEAEAMLFSRPAYEALRADYRWQQDALELKLARLRAAAGIDTTATALLATTQAALARSRADNRELALARDAWRTRYELAAASQRPPLLFDGRLYLGGGIGLTVGALGAAYLLLVR